MILDLLLFFFSIFLVIYFYDLSKEQENEKALGRYLICLLLIILFCVFAVLNLDNAINGYIDQTILKIETIKK